MNNQSFAIHILLRNKNKNKIKNNNIDKMRNKKYNAWMQNIRKCKLTYHDIR